MVRAKWKVPFVDYKLLKNIIRKKKRFVIRTKSRSSIILQSFIGLVVQVYTGRKYINVYINEKMVGHKLGEFSYTRRVGRIHRKQERKFKLIKK